MNAEIERAVSGFIGWGGSAHRVSNSADSADSRPSSETESIQRDAMPSDIQAVRNAVFPAAIGTFPVSGRGQTSDATLRRLSQDEIAAKFLADLRRDFPRGATLTARDVMHRYVDWLLEGQIEPVSWLRVARPFRRLLGQQKKYGTAGSARVVVYVLPRSA